MLHAGHVPDPHVGARAVPIYLAASYVFQYAKQSAELFDLKLHGIIYNRISNPTTALFEERLASLESGAGAGRSGFGWRHGGPIRRVHDAARNVR